MSRKVKRELLARLLTIAAITGPITLAIVIGITLHTLLNWEGRAALVVVIGAVFSIAFGVMAINIWDKYKDAKCYTHLKDDSFLRDWIEEPEKVKSPPGPGAWEKEKE